MRRSSVHISSRDIDDALLLQHPNVGTTVTRTEAPIARFLITANGIAIGEFEGDDEAEAIEAFAREAGYESIESMRESLGERSGEKPWLDVTSQRLT